MQISFKKTLEESNGTLVLGVFEEKTLTKSAQIIDSQIQGTLKKAIENSSFSGKKDEILSILAPHGIQNAQVLLIGLGNPKNLSFLDFQELGGKLMAALDKAKDTKVVVDIIDDRIRNLPEMAAYIAAGINLRSWKFDKYKTKKKDESLLKEFIFITPEPTISEKTFEPLKHIAEGVALTRDVVSEPPNVLFPESMAEIAYELKRLKVSVEILDEKHMKKLGMGALLGVGQGSIQESKLIILQWMHGPKGEPPVAFIGKGVTFDTGGISIKPSNGMEEMKYDMAGSGVILGLFKALALRGAKVNAVGIMGMVENMPSGSAQRPADVVTSMSGQTIEVINTDAEGRLVLADALWYTQDRFKPQAMIDLATLTGAISVALGWEYAGLFSNNDDLAHKLTDAGNSVGEKLWRLPMGDSYDKDIDSEIADVKNTGSGRGAGSITAAQFLQRFVNNIPWAHLDIAGMAWEKKGKPLVGKGASAFGVRLLNEFLMRYYEDRN
jgi:leucyl aminopeptidase